MKLMSLRGAKNGNKRGRPVIEVRRCSSFRIPKVKGSGAMLTPIRLPMGDPVPTAIETKKMHKRYLDRGRGNQQANQLMTHLM